MLADAILFYVLAAVAVIASVLVIAQRRPIYSVLLLIASFVALAGLYVILNAPFLAVIQIIIYTGAIMVLFLFVVMLLNTPYEEPADIPRLAENQSARSGQSLSGRGPRRLGILIGVGLLVELLWALWRATMGIEAQMASRVSFRLGAGEQDPRISSVREIGRVLYTQYGFAFEVTSILIIVAMVGAVVLAKREI